MFKIYIASFNTKQAHKHGLQRRTLFSVYGARVCEQLN